MNRQEAETSEFHVRISADHANEVKLQNQQLYTVYNHDDHVSTVNYQSLQLQQKVQRCMCGAKKW